MKLLVIKALWGMEGLPLTEAIHKIVEAGYDGVEGVSPSDMSLLDFKHLLRDTNMKWVAQTPAQTPEALQRAIQTATPLEPIRYVCQAGRDSMTRDEGCRFFEAALDIQDRLNIEIAFETHRGRLLNTPMEAMFYLQKFPQMRLTADFSHWVCVCERLPEDLADVMAQACERAMHIHGRVGHEESPQVSDPSAPEFAAQLAWHEKQWDAIRKAQEARGMKEITFTPEYGPPYYMQALPHTGVPVADLWKVCLWGANRQRGRWTDLD